MTIIRIDSNLIVDEETFHRVFAEAFGFPSFYGSNMNAWVDCMGYLDNPAAEMSSVHVTPGKTLALVIDEALALKQRCPAIFESLVEGVAFVNWRCVEQNSAALLALAMCV